MNTYEVSMRSAPGMWAAYQGTVTVVAESDYDAEERAKDALKRGAYADRPRNSWVVDEIRRVVRGAKA